MGAWWPLLMLVYVPLFVGRVMRVAIGRSFRHLDRSHPDDLPFTAGEWLGHEIARLGLADRITIITTDDVASDAYHLRHETIQLTPDTYFKRDPMHWAIAAHELGHARFRLAYPILGRLLTALHFVKVWVLSLALALALSNIVFAIRGVTELAFALFVAGAVMHLGVLLEEAIASILAMRSLRHHDAFAWSHLRSARIALVLAFSTYAVNFAARVLLLTQWHHLEALSRTPNVPPLAVLTPFGTALAAIASSVLVVFAITRVSGAVHSGKARKENPLFGFLFQVALLAFVLLVWNVRADADFARWVALAIIPIMPWFVVVLALPMLVVDILIVNRYENKLAVDPTHRTEALDRDRDHESGVAARAKGKLAMAALLERTMATPSFEYRISQLLRTAYIPLVIAFWLS